MKPAKQFVIWGKAPAEPAYEALLVSEHAGIVSKEHAERVIKQLQNEHGCKECRYMELKPLHELNVQQMFAAAVNI